MWFGDLTADIAATFAMLEGCDLPMIGGHGEMRLDGFSIWSPEKKLEDERARRADPLYALRRKAKGRQSENAAAAKYRRDNAEKIKERRAERVRLGLVKPRPPRPTKGCGRGGKRVGAGRKKKA